MTARVLRIFGPLTAALIFMFALGSSSASAQERSGSVRGIVLDGDFDNVPLPAVQVTIVETGQKATTSDQGNFVINEVSPGTYTLVFSKPGFVREVRANVVVVAGKLTDVNASLGGDFEEMEEFVVQDTLQGGAGTEAALLQLRIESPALIDSISSELISKAGASDAAGALRLVAGATVQDGKFAVIRGLPDRYVSSQLNGVRLPSADDETRAVELDQFPSSVIESIQVSKTFTPDQQGDASGGAVDVRLKGIPEETSFSFKSQLGFNSQVRFRDDFLTYNGGGVNFFGYDDGRRDVQRDRIGQSWEGAVGVTTDDAPIDYKWSVNGSHKFELDNGLKVGGSANFFYERDSAYDDDGRQDNWWVDEAGTPLQPQFEQGTPTEGEFLTSLFDVTRATQSVQWGGLATLGAATEFHELNLVYLFTRSVQDTAILAEDTRGKEFYFPGYDPDDPFSEGNSQGDSRFPTDNRRAAPYLRAETLEYIERQTTSLQLNGRHEFPIEEFGIEDVLDFKAPVFDWTLSNSTASSDSPDKRQFGTKQIPTSFDPGRPPFSGPEIDPPFQEPFLPGANINFGNLQRIFQSIEEESDQLTANLRLPFDQWTDTPGFLKFGVFADQVDREFVQQSFTNSDDFSTFDGDFGEYWSEVFPFEDHPLDRSGADPLYDGEQDIFAYYGMLNLPLTPWLKMIGGARIETTDISTDIIFDEDISKDLLIFDIRENSIRRLDEAREFDPEAGNADIDQTDVLPAIGFELLPTESVKIRASYSQTIARQTFRELTPVIQQEFLGGPIFVGNNELEVSSLDNYDLRVDYSPYPGGLFSASYFYKDIEDPIEFIQQRALNFTYTTADNFPEGELSGFEFEVRQQLGRLWEPLDGVAFGANATFIESEVTFRDRDIAEFENPRIGLDLTTRDATGAPDFLYNLFLTYDLLASGTEFGLFYTVQGETLVAGAGVANNNFVPDVYQEEFGTLNFSLTQNLGRYLKLVFQAKNLTNPDIETFYSNDGIAGPERVQSSFSRGIDYSISLSAEIPF